MSYLSPGTLSASLSNEFEIVSHRVILISRFSIFNHNFLWPFLAFFFLQTPWTRRLSSLVTEVLFIFVIEIETQMRMGTAEIRRRWTAGRVERLTSKPRQIWAAQISRDISCVRCCSTTTNLRNRILRDSYDVSSSTLSRSVSSSNEKIVLTTCQNLQSLMGKNIYITS